MIFEATIAQMAEDLDLPYPAKTEFLDELRADLAASFEAHLAEGLTEGEAFEATLRDFQIGIEDLGLLSRTHTSVFRKLLSRLPEQTQTLVQYLSGVLPLGLSVYAIEREVDVLNLIQEGGSPGMYAIVLIGLYLLGLELLSAFRILFLRDHSKRNLQIETSNVLLGCLGLMLIATAWTIMGVYNTAQAMSLNPTATATLFEGIKESLVPVSTGLLLSAVVVLAHFATRHILHKWKAPVS